MNIVHIENGHDARLADYAGVPAPALFRDRGLLIAEGRFVVRRLLHSTRLRWRSLLLNEAALEGLRDTLQGAAPSLDVFVASPEVVTVATGFNMHRGCLGVAERFAEQPLGAVYSTGRLVVILERGGDADNAG